MLKIPRFETDKYHGRLRHGSREGSRHGRQPGQDARDGPAAIRRALGEIAGFTLVETRQAFTAWRVSLFVKTIYAGFNAKGGTSLNRGQ